MLVSTFHFFTSRGKREQQELFRSITGISPCCMATLEANKLLFSPDHNNLVKADLEETECKSPSSPIMGEEKPLPENERRPPSKEVIDLPVSFKALELAERS